MARPAQRATGHGPGADHRRRGRDGRVQHGQLLAGETPGNVITLPTNAAGGPGATLATLDTTTLPNGSYIIDVTGTDNHGNQQDNESWWPSPATTNRAAWSSTSRIHLPLAGLPITIGRRYDSLNKDKVGDFGNGWSLTVGHPDLEVDPANDVTITHAERPARRPSSSSCSRPRSARSCSGSSPSRCSSRSRASSGP